MERCSVAEIVQNVQFLVFLLVFFFICITTNGVVSRTLGPDSGTRDFAIELNASSFNSSLWAAPARWAIVEFYAHWCPACRNYKPQYERVARLFNGPEAIHPGFVYMAKVDCALKVNAPLCDRFKIAHYPTLLWAPPSNFGWASGEHGKWEAIEKGRKAELLLQFINNKIGKAFTLDDAITYENHLLKGHELDFGQVAISNFDIEEATAKAMDIIMIDKEMEYRRGICFVVDQPLEFVQDPFRWRGHASANTIVQVLHHSGILRQCYRQPHVFVGLYKTSWYREVWTTEFLGYYHVSFDWDHDTNQCRAIVWFVGFMRPINATPTYIGGHEEYRVRIFTQINTLERIYHDLLEFGPWTFIRPNVVSRRLHF